ncbi:ribonuclease 3-like protein 1 [Durio zibethinus]|uniref:Ribonuclease 3-like protein 1 n=1 Tax=Durio zibethinus TaxID=66656 RepID=A0A6P5WZV8_DURZI|nr:ribonuclease 3-like protein 1 [Durio zibethinus]
MKLSPTFINPKMEKTKSNKKPQRFIVNLKNLPPIDPSIIIPLYQDKYENASSRNEPNVPRPGSKEGTKLLEFDQVPRKAGMADRNLRQNMEVEEDFCLSSTKLIDPNSTKDFNFNKENEICHSNFAVEDALKTASAKSQLYEICSANKWNFPLYECCKEEGPSHRKLFTFKVVVEIKEASTTTILECFSDPHSKKKMAADHAAEGALWYLEHVGHFPPIKRSKAS